MSCHSPEQTSISEADLRDEVYILVGNANVGKSVIFNHLAGKYLASVSNYPGTTVEISKTDIKLHDKDFYLIDTPGISSFNPHSDDEKVTSQILLESKVKGIILVGDAKNLHRTLVLTFQIALTGLPIVLILNMADEMRKNHLSINIQRLEELLGVPVFLTTAITGEGLDNFFSKTPKELSLTIQFPKEIEKIISDLCNLVPKHPIWHGRGLAIQLLRNDPVIKEWVKNNTCEETFGQIMDIIDNNVVRFTPNIEFLIIQQLDILSQKIVRAVLNRNQNLRSKRKELLDRITINPITGFPILILVLLSLYLLVGVLGAGELVDFIEGTIFNEWLNPFLSDLIKQVIPIEVGQKLLIGEYGIVTVGITYALGVVLPIVAVFFLFFSILEDSGYLPRIAVLLNKLFQRIGLNGKAVLPLILGTGCDTMATLSTRVLETRKERLITTMILALGIPCSAQLGVVLGITAGISPVVFFVVFGIVALQIFIVGGLMNRVVKGESQDFLLVLPPLRLPQLSNVVLKTIARIEIFIREALPIFILGTLFVGILDIVGILPILIDLFKPIVNLLLGLPADTSIAFILGFIRRDFGAAGLYQLAPTFTINQVIVATVVLILFIPCFANILMISKEYGKRIAIAMFLFIIPYAIAVGTILNIVLSLLGIVII